MSNDHVIKCPACATPINLVEDRRIVPYIPSGSPEELKERNEYRCRACRQYSTIHPDPIGIGATLLVLGALAATTQFGFSKAGAVALGLVVVVVGSRFARRLRLAGHSD